jgi:hypothetical protein
MAATLSYVAEQVKRVRILGGQTADYGFSPPNSALKSLQQFFGDLDGVESGGKAR